MVGCGRFRSNSQTFLCCRRRFHQKIRTIYHCYSLPCPVGYCPQGDGRAQSQCDTVGRDCQYWNPSLRSVRHDLEELMKRSPVPSRRSQAPWVHLYEHCCRHADLNSVQTHCTLLDSQMVELGLLFCSWISCLHLGSNTWGLLMEPTELAPSSSGLCSSSSWFRCLFDQGAFQLSVTTCKIKEGENNSLSEERKTLIALDNN